MVFVKIWSHIFIYSKWSNLQLGDDTERDIFFSVFLEQPQKTHGISWLQIQIKVWSWLLGDSSSFWDPPSPLEVFLDVTVAQNDLNKWSPQCSDRSSLPWNIHAFFRTTCRFWGKQHMWSIQRKRQWRQSLPRQSPKQQLTLQEQNVSNRKRPKGTTSSRRRLIPANETRRSGKGSASSQTPKKAILQMTVRKPYANTLLSSSQRRAAVLSSLSARRTRMAQYTKGWNLFSPGRCLPRTVLFCANPNGCRLVKHRQARLLRNKATSVGRSLTRRRK